MRKKLLVFLLLPLVLIIALSGLVTYRASTQALKKANHEQMQTLRQALKSIAETSYEITQQIVTSNLKVAQALIEPKIHWIPNLLTIPATHQVSGLTTPISIPQMGLDGEPAYQNTRWVDSVSQLVGGATTLFQIVPQGMLRIATSVRKTDGSRATGTYIPESSPVYKTILQGKSFFGRAFVANDWYVTAYSPVIRSGKIIGAIFVGIPQGNLEVLRKYIVSFQVGEHGYAQIIDTSGRRIIHPDSTQQGLVEKYENQAQMIQNQEGFFHAIQKDSFRSQKGKKVLYAYTLIPQMQWLIMAGAYQ